MVEHVTSYESASRHLANARDKSLYFQQLLPEKVRLPLIKQIELKRQHLSIWLPLARKTIPLEEPDRPGAAACHLATIP